MYRSTSVGAEASWQLEVTGTASRDGVSYAVVTGFPAGPRWLRRTTDNKIFALDPDAGRESLWYDLSAEGTKWNTGQDQCSPVAALESLKAEYRGPVGEFNNAVMVRYPPGSCADAGLAQDVFLPGVGLVSRSITTIAGPRTWDLVYSRLGTSTVISEPAVAFSLTLDRGAYYYNPLSLQPRDTTPVLNARLTLRNTTADPLPLEFASGQTFDLVIRNSENKEVYRWSYGQAFTMVFRTEQFTGESNWMVSAKLAGDGGAVLPAGGYTAEAWLTTTSEQRFSAKGRFEIRYPAQRLPGAKP
ncbi:MAG: hypothetical protein IT161_19740 [Bryobacterales bacterium]|nr:hypothetical protein [Bryobacterales bacterium]